MAAQGQASARPQVSSGREGKGMPWYFGGAGTAYEGEQGAWSTGGAPGVFREQVQLVKMSRGLGGKGMPLVLWGSKYSFWG